MSLPPRNLRLKHSLLGLVSFLLLLVVVVPASVFQGSVSAQTSVGATGQDPRAFPKTFHIWGGEPWKYTKYDIVIGYPSWDLASLRAANPGALYLANPMLDPFNPDWTRRKGTAVTYGAADEFTGASDTLVDGSAANLGQVPAWNAYWDTLHRPDGTIAPVSDAWAHEGWNLTRTETSEKVAKITAYAAKLSKIYANGWDGIWSDNWIYRIGASWFYGENLDTNRDGRVDDIDAVQRQWWDGLTLVGNRLRSYLPGKIVGGNGAHQVSGLVQGVDPNGPFKSTNISMNEVLEYWLSVRNPDTVVSEVQSYLGFADPLGMRRYFLLMHRLPGGQGDYRSMRAGFSLATIAGAYYEPYAVDHADAFSYDEFTGGALGKRGWLGQPVSAPLKLGNGVWRRDFENGVVLNNSTSSAQTLALGGSYNRLKGSQDPTVNSGGAVTSVTIPAGDGLFLVGSAGSSSGAPPQNTALPVISGTPVAGQTLSASQGTWTGSPTSFAYQWQRCNTAGASCADVAGANGASYSLAAVDVSSTMRFKVTATNGSGLATAASAASGVVTSPQSFAVTHNIASGSTLSATVTWSAAPAGKTASKVEFSIDGQLTATDLSAPFSTTVDTTKLANESHTFSAKATAADGAVAVVSSNAKVSNEVSSANAQPNTATYAVAQSIGQGQTLSRTLAWTATTSGSKTTARVEFFVDGALAWTERYAPYVYSGDGQQLDTRELSDGNHTLSVKAFASDGAAASIAATVQVVNTPTTPPAPSFTISQSIADGQALSGSLPWTATTAGNKTTARVEFFVDGALAWTERYVPYVYAGDGAKLDTRDLSDGNHTLSVKAFASDGTSVTSAVTVRVVNAAAAPAPTPPAPTPPLPTAPAPTPPAPTPPLPTAPAPTPPAPVPPTSSFTVTHSIATGQTLTGRVSWTAVPAGKTATRVEFFVDGRLAWTENYAPWVYAGDGAELDARTLGPGDHTLSVKAHATDGSTASASAAVTVSAPSAPTPSGTTLVSSIVDGAEITGSVAWTIKPSGKPISRIDFFIDARMAWREHHAPYTFGGDGQLLDTNTLGRGKHTLSVQALHTDGTVTSLTLVVTVV